IRVDRDAGERRQAPGIESPWDRTVLEEGAALPELRRADDLPAAGGDLPRAGALEADGSRLRARPGRRLRRASVDAEPGQSTGGALGDHAIDVDRPALERRRAGRADDGVRPLVLMEDRLAAGRPADEIDPLGGERRGVIGTGRGLGLTERDRRRTPAVQP